MVFRVTRIQGFVCAVILLLGCAAYGVFAEDITVDVRRGTPLPIVMYHQVTTRPSRAGRYAVTAEQLEKDFVYIASRGYTPITAAELLDHINDGVPLPEKPIMITFDDGFETFVTIVMPLLEKYNLKAVVSIIGSCTDFFSENEDHNTSYSYLTWEQAAALTENEHAEVQNHSDNMHRSVNGRKGANKKRGESLEDYRAALTLDAGNMQKKLFENTGSAARVYAFPFGAYCKDSREIIREMGFEAIFVCEERINYIDLENTDWLFNLGRFNRASGKSSEKFFSRLLD